MPLRARHTTVKFRYSLIFSRSLQKAPTRQHSRSIKVTLASLRILESDPVRLQIINDAFTCVGKSDPADKQNEEHNIRERCSAVHDLWTTKIRTILVVLIG